MTKISKNLALEIKNKLNLSIGSKLIIGANGPFSRIYTVLSIEGEQVTLEDVNTGYVFKNSFRQMKSYLPYLTVKYVGQ
jgi:hypothetical protein